jgi:hypothetical protein
MLACAHRALHPGGRLVFETRDPARRAWQQWTREASYRVARVADVGLVETWIELTAVRLPLVTFRHTWVFASDGAVLTSDSTLRFRQRTEITNNLAQHGYVLEEVRDAPDRPSREFVFIVRRAG